MLWKIGLPLLEGFSVLFVYPQIPRPPYCEEILASARRITSLTRECLDYYLAQFRSCKPQHLINRKFQLRGYQPWEVRPGRRGYRTQEVGPPSWTEETRVSRAFWRIQIICDLKKAASHFLLSWPMDDIERLNSEEPVEHFHQEHLYTFLYREEPHPEFEELRSVMNYAQIVRGENITRQLEQAPGSPEVHRESLSTAPSENDWTELDHSSAGCKYYYSYVNHGRNFFGYGLSPLRHISFHPFRRLGLAFWDLQRMSAYGLLPPTQEPWDEFQTTFYLFAWQSLLGTDEVAEHERQNMAKFVGSRWA